MPFFLVNHTSLVEADDEIAAAQRTLARLRDGDKQTFTVKFDQENVTQVVLQLAQAVPPPDSHPIAPEIGASDALKKTPALMAHRDIPDATIHRNRLGKTITSLLIFAVGLCLGFGAYAVTQL
ncbi:hypothetical protein J2T08_006093 [Neorhizobium galegae]|uniref:hypothetical protein n=1 Tax=Neorhizobium galegae TaxID=399 RepID=UPI001AE56CE5|nr:hypothetical protein [Neorhizobium galegae]MBP2562385.1 hypothetical protein [Neorhizobium galegae]MDQ0138148.1 hypothetical protein [Neorhizobium galegae]